MFNIAYSPELNPIENFFNLVKNRYKRLKKSSLVKTGKFDQLKLIEASFDCQDVGSVRSICEHGLKKPFRLMISKVKVKLSLQMLNYILYEELIVC